MDFLKIEEELLNREPGPIDIKRESSVLIPLVDIDGEWYIIFQLRAKDMNAQPGEVSFPGGRMENNESRKETAIRETMEELNIDRNNIKILGELDYLVSHHNMRINCFLGIIDGIDIDDIKPNRDEVDHIFKIPLEYFLEYKPRKYRLGVKTLYNEEFPYELIPKGKDYKFHGEDRDILFYIYNDYVIWGYTATMMNSCIEIIKDLKI